ncbi:serine hydrolase domain-containing protein [Pollutibacter soli]|uniref:serine hydrolase domain-containing protein n=1 Tax=Pollutibacter soli TaxID=3034157 RepID=UPI00301393D0
MLQFFPGRSNAQTAFARFADSVMDAEKEFNGVVLVADQGKPVYHKAFGYRDLNVRTPLLASDIFELASVSKQFTAFIIMKLKEQGKLNYDDSVSKYLDIPYKGITIRHLLTHTSGLPDYQEIMDKHWDKTKVAGNTEILEYLRIYAPPVLFIPGEKYKYSNTGYVLLASIAEKAAGRDFIQLCREWVFIPAKMRSTDIRSPKEKKATKNFTSGFEWIESSNRYVRADSFPDADYTIWLGNRKGPGRISSVAADLLLWDEELYTNHLIKQSTLSEAFNPMKLNDGTLSAYGFGWELIDDPKTGKTVMHTGENPGYTTIIIRYIGKHKTIIMLSNNAYPELGRLVRKFESVLLSNN